MNFDKVNEAIGELAVLKFFPSEPAARLAIVKLVGKLAASEDQVKWLVARMLVLYNEWPGPKEMRALFCSRFRPQDGIEAHSEKFIDGFPSDPPPLQVLPAGSPIRRLK